MSRARSRSGERVIRSCIPTVADDVSRGIGTGVQQWPRAAGRLGFRLAPGPDGPRGPQLRGPRVREHSSVALLLLALELVVDARVRGIVGVTAGPVARARDLGA